MGNRERGKRPALTDRQLEAVTAGDRDLWLTAGAGSGKTSVLTERYLHLHLEREIPIRKILAITFTEKAAAEMRERIAGSLQERGKSASLREIPHAPILTIDSLCYRLIREYGEAAGIDPTVKVLDPGEAAEWQDRVWVSLLDSWWRDRREDLLLLLRTLAWRIDAEQPGGVDPTPLFSLVRAIRTAGRSVDEVSFEADLGPHRRVAEAALEKLFPELERLQGEKVTEKTKSKLREILSLRPGGPVGTGDSDSFRLVRGRVNRIVSKPAKEAVDRAIALIDERLALDEEELLRPVRCLLGRLARQFQLAFTGEKAKAGVADFLDLEEAALRLLSDDRLRKEIGSRFSYLLLDECQDTNELQLRIVGRLRNPGRFLAVGDAKQSIYAFRDADVTAFVEMDAGLGSGAKRIVLEKNFRSRPEILDWVNILFPKIWEGNEKMRVPYEELRFAEEKRKDFPPKEEPSIEFLVIRGGKSRKAREREADLLARRLREIHEERLDDLHFGGMAVLFRSTADLRLYERRMRVRGVPALVAVGRGFFQTREVTDLLVGLSLVDDPGADLPFAAALRSPLAGVDDRDLAALLIGEEGRSSSLWARVRDRKVLASLSPEGEERTGRFTRVLEELRSLRGRVSPFRLLERLVFDTGYLESCLLLPEGLRLRANVRKLLEISRELDEKAALSIPETIRRLQDFRYTHLREPESALDTEKEAVRLLTIHGAKGMQFPLVAVVDLGRADPADRSIFLFHKELGVGVKRREPPGGRKRKPWLFEKIREKRKELEEAEKNRLLYVAMTRAERHLILSGGMEDRPKGWLAQIAGAIDLPEDPGLREVEGVKVRFLGAGEAETAAVRTLLPAELLESPDRFAGEADRAASDSVLRRLRAPAPAAGPDPAGRTVTAVKSFSVCPRRFRLSRLFPLPDRPEPGRGEGVPLGTDFHRMMEREWRGLPPAERNEELIGWRENLLAHPEMEPFLRAGWREGEVSFTAPVSGRELRGKIDLLARTGEDRRILDYKTDRAGAEELLDRYRVSLNLYRLGIERVVGGEGGVEAWIYGAREGVFIEVPEGEEEALASLEEYDRAEEEGVWPPRKNRECGSCLYRRDCPHPSFSAPDEKK